MKAAPEIGYGGRPSRGQGDAQMRGRPTLGPGGKKETERVRRGEGETGASPRPSMPSTRHVLVLPRGLSGVGALLALFAFAALALCGCYYAEMRDDEAVQAYNQEFPQMPKKTVPVDGGIWVEREANPMELENPLSDNSRIVAWGWERYHFYCIQCHGPKLDGNGTVGQSFAPLPANLTGSQVQDQTDGEIFYKIRFGFNRHPVLYSTVTDNETWAIIRYLRSVR